MQLLLVRQLLLHGPQVEARGEWGSLLHVVVAQRPAHVRMWLTHAKSMVKHGVNDLVLCGIKRDEGGGEHGGGGGG